MRRLIPLLAILLSLPLFAERVRVVVAVGVPEVSALGVTELRSGVMQSLHGATHVQQWGKEGVAFSAEVERDEVEQLRRDPRVRAVSIDEGGQGGMLESLPHVGMNVVRPQGLTGEGVTIAVLDTGIDTDHPDFAGRIVAEQCFCDAGNGVGCCPGGGLARSGAGAAEDDHGHGTHVTGIIASGGVRAPMGIAPKAKIVSVKVMDANNSFRSFPQIYQGLEWIYDSRPDVRVINMSLGSFALYSAEACPGAAVSLGLEPIIAKLRQRGVLITASSGNQGSTTGTTLPACMADVLGIGATYDKAMAYNGSCSAPMAQVDEVTCFTNSTTSIDLVAPGATIASSARGGFFVNMAGTSMAAPHVAGAIALMVQASSGIVTANALESILKVTGKRVTDTRTGLMFPRLDIAAALAATPRAASDGPRRRGVRH